MAGDLPSSSVSKLKERKRVRENKKMKRRKDSTFFSLSSFSLIYCSIPFRIFTNQIDKPMMTLILLTGMMN